MDRTRWLERRRKGIGGSDAAAILGLSRYHSAVDVWEDKLGLAPERPQTAAMSWGLRLEDAIALAFTETTGIELRRPGGIRRAHHVRDFPMIASVDRIADGAVVELKKKRSDDDLHDDGPAELRVPPDWYVQGQHYAEVLELEVIHYAVLVAGTTFRHITVPRDRAFGADLREEEGRFWRDYVLTETQPPVSGDDLAFLRRKYPVSTDVELVATPELANLVDAYLAAVSDVEDAEHKRDDLRAVLEERMGEASKLIAPSGTVSWKSHERTSTSWKEVAGSYRKTLERLRAAGGDVRLWIDGALSTGFGTTEFDEIEALYSQTTTVRPFVARKAKEA